MIQVKMFYHEITAEKEAITLQTKINKFLSEVGIKKLDIVDIKYNIFCPVGSKFIKESAMLIYDF